MSMRSKKKRRNRALWPNDPHPAEAEFELKAKFMRSMGMNHPYGGYVSIASGQTEFKVVPHAEQRCVNCSPKWWLPVCHAKEPFWRSVKRRIGVLHHRL